MTSHYTDNISETGDKRRRVSQEQRSVSIGCRCFCSSSSFFFPLIASFGPRSKRHMFLNASFTNEHFLMTSLLLLISCWRGKPRPHPLRPPRGSVSLPRAGSSLTDSFLIWWGGGEGPRGLGRYYALSFHWCRAFQ